MRKAIFMIVILVMTLSYAGFYFVPEASVHKVPLKNVYDLSMASIGGCPQIEKVGIALGDSMQTTVYILYCILGRHSSVSLPRLSTRVLSHSLQVHS